jgi:hypothetical protein
VPSGWILNLGDICGNLLKKVFNCEQQVCRIGQSFFIFYFSPGRKARFLFFTFLNNSPFFLLVRSRPNMPKELDFKDHSPSIKLNGIDLEDKNEGYGFNCRLYRMDGELTGAPSKEYIREKQLSKAEFKV